MYTIQFAANAINHLRGFEAGEQKTILRGVREQLLHEPTRITRNRKPMRPNPVAAWELRQGNFRVYYDVDDDTRVVAILAIGIKSRNQIVIGGEEVIL